MKMKLQRIFLLTAVYFVFGIISPAINIAGAAVQKKTINKNGIVADLFFNKEAINQRALILLGGAEGGKALSKWTKEINGLVQQGYAVLVPAYFGLKGLPPTLQSIPLEYFEKTIDWITGQPFVDPGGIGIIAGSKGSEAALLLATMNHNIKAVVAIAPSAYVFWGIRGPGGKNQITSSWSYHGKDIPFAPVVSSDEKIIKAMKTHKFLQLYNDATKSPKAIKARIIIEKAKAPILFVSGKRDELWPSYNMAQSMIKRLKESKYPYYYKHLTYNVGHDVIHEVPESWNEILSFLKVHYPSSAKMTRKAN